MFSSAVAAGLQDHIVIYLCIGKGGFGQLQLIVGLKYTFLITKLLKTGLFNSSSIGCYFKYIRNIFIF